MEIVFVTLIYKYDLYIKQYLDSSQYMFINNFLFFRIHLKVDHTFCELIGDLYIS